MQIIYSLFKISQLIIDHFINFILIKGTRYNSYKETLLGFYASVLLLILSQAAVSSPISSRNLRLIIGDLFEVIEIKEGCRWALKLVDDDREPIAEWADYAEGMTKLMMGIQGQQIEVVSLNSLYTELYLLVNKGEVYLENENWQSHICHLKTDFTVGMYPYDFIGHIFLKACLKSLFNSKLTIRGKHSTLSHEINQLKTGNENEVKGMGDKIVQECLHLPGQKYGYRAERSLMEEADLSAWTAKKIHQTMEVEDQTSGNINITILDRISSGVVFCLFDLIRGLCGQYSGTTKWERHESDYGVCSEIIESCYSSLLFYKPQTKELYPPCDSGRYEVRSDKTPVEVVVTKLPKPYEAPKIQALSDILVKELTEDMRVGNYKLTVFDNKKKAINNILLYKPCDSNPLDRPQQDAIERLVSYIYKNDINEEIKDLENLKSDINGNISKIFKHLNLEQGINDTRTY